MLPNNVCHLLLLLVEEEKGGGGGLKAGTRMMEKETFCSKIEISKTYPSLGPFFLPFVPR